MTTRFSKFDATRNKIGIKKCLEQFLDKRRVDTAYWVLYHLYLEGNYEGVPQKRLVKEVSELYEIDGKGICEKRVRRTIADLLRIGAIVDIGAARTVRIYRATLQSLQGYLGTLGREFERIDKGMKKKLKEKE